MNDAKPETLQGLEEAIRFGLSIAIIDSFFGHTIYFFESPHWSDNVRKTIASQLDSYRNLVQRIVETVDQKYAGIKAAEESKVLAQKRLVELEKAACPYLP